MIQRWNARVSLWGGRGVSRDWLRAMLGLVAGVLAMASTPIARAAEPQLPIVFVHGQSGSAQQFETQAMRFTSNGYPQQLLFAFEYDTSQATQPLAALDAFIDDDGTIRQITDMAPKTDTLHCSQHPVRYALEMEQGWFAKKGAVVGSKIGGLPSPN